MTLVSLLTRPITLIAGLSIALVGIGMVSPHHARRTFPSIVTSTNVVQVTPTQTSSARATQTTGTAPVIYTPPATTSSRHYSLPASLRGDGGDKHNDD